MPSPRCRATCWSTSAPKRCSELVDDRDVARRPAAADAAARPLRSSRAICSPSSGCRATSSPRGAGVAIGEMIERGRERPDHQLVGRARRRRSRAGPLHARRRRRARRRPTSRRSTASSTRWCAAGSRAVEEALGELVGAAARDPARAHLSRRLPRRLSRPAPSAEEARQDIVCGSPGSTTPASATCACSARDDDAPDRLRLKIYRARRADPAVRSGAGAREFRLPRARGDADRRSAAARIGYIHDFLLRDAARRRRRRRCWRAPRWSSGRSPSVLEGEAENDAFNQLIVVGRRSTPRDGRAVPRLVPLSAPDRPRLSRWSPWSTRCAARRRSTAGLIDLFDALHDPGARRRPRDEAVQGGRARRSTRASRASRRSTRTASCA